MKRLVLLIIALIAAGFLAAQFAARPARPPAEGSSQVRRPPSPPRSAVQGHAFDSGALPRFFKGLERGVLPAAASSRELIDKAFAAGSEDALVGLLECGMILDEQETRELAGRLVAQGWDRALDALLAKDGCGQHPEELMMETVKQGRLSCLLVLEARGLSFDPAASEELLLAAQTAGDRELFEHLISRGAIPSEEKLYKTIEESGFEELESGSPATKSFLAKDGGEPFRIQAIRDAEGNLGLTLSQGKNQRSLLLVEGATTSFMLSLNDKCPVAWKESMDGSEAVPVYGRQHVGVELQAGLLEGKIWYRLASTDLAGNEDATGVLRTTRYLHAQACGEIEAGELRETVERPLTGVEFSSGKEVTDIEDVWRAIFCGESRRKR
jgi:hypothetical protein